MLRIDYHPQLTDPSLLDQVWQILCDYDDAFVPPLSGRRDTSQQDLLHPHDAPRPTAYFQVLRQQAFLLAMDGDTVAGFFSFTPGKRVEALEEAANGQPVCYISTIVVRREYRGQQITRRFYQQLLALPQVTDQFFATRTWSTNTAHLKVLEQMGFSLCRREEDARGDGIDTVYYCRLRERNSNNTVEGSV